MLEVRQMSQDEIARLLGRGWYGHLGCARDGHPYVVPMSYAYDRGDIYFLTTERSKAPKGGRASCSRGAPNCSRPPPRSSAPCSSSPSATPRSRPPSTAPRSAPGRGSAASPSTACAPKPSTAA